MLDRLSASTLLRSVIAVMAVLVLILLSNGAWNSAQRLAQSQHGQAPEPMVQKWRLGPFAHQRPGDLGQRRVILAGSASFEDEGHFYRLGSLARRLGGSRRDLFRHTTRIANPPRGGPSAQDPSSRKSA